MRNTERVLQFSVIVLVVYTSVIVAIAEGSVFPYSLTALFALGALVVSRKWPKLQLNTLTANVLGLLAFALAGGELLTGSIEARLLSGAHLMAYLSWIILWQRKRFSQYWWLFALCLVQVAIGAILLSTVLYGLFLLGFLLISIWTLAVFSLHRSYLRFAPDETDDRKEATVSSASRAVGAVQIDTNRWITARFLSGLLGITVMSAVVGIVFFLLIPRHWVGAVAWGFDRSHDTGLVGFGDSVSLGSFGTLLESREVVMEVRLFETDGSPLAVEDYSRRLGFDSPLFRGSVLDVYRDGKWSRPRQRALTRILPTSSASGTVRQEYRLKPIRSNILFVIQQNPLRSVRGSKIVGDRPKVADNPVNFVIRHSVRRGSTPLIRYEVYTASTSGNANSRTSYVLPSSRAISDRELKKQLRDYVETEIGVVPGDSPKERVRKIISHLRDSEKFTYTLKIPRQEFPSLDPVMEFLRHRRSGHCQFYATALALLLRASGVPSRIVWGFKGGQKNDLTGYFEVQQRNAHAWVEARLDGRWFTFDATPAAAVDAVQADEGFLQTWHNFKNLLSSIWTRFVTGMTYEDQKISFYAPLTATAKDAWNSVSQEREKSATGLQTLKEFLKNPRRWFSWQGGLLSFVILLTVASLAWSAKKVLGLLRTLSAGRSFANDPRIRVAFYERFRQLCADHGMVKHPSQTQREFASDVVAGWNHMLQPAGMAPVPETLVSAFYDVRFGAGTLSEEQHRDIDRMLNELERHLAEQNGNPPR